MKKICFRVALHNYASKKQSVLKKNLPTVRLLVAMVNHVLNDLEVSCLPQDLPEFLEVNLSNLTTTKDIQRVSYNI